MKTILISNAKGLEVGRKLLAKSNCTTNEISCVLHITAPRGIDKTIDQIMIINK